MKVSTHKAARAFTLIETVIAIGVLAVLLTTFLTVFGPATEGIRRAISAQEADRLSSTLERELSILRPDQQTETIKTAFDKAYTWIGESVQNENLLYVYQYRGNANKLRKDGSCEPFTDVKGVVGKEFIVQPMMRRRSDPLFMEDLEALEGRVFAVKLTQLVFEKGELKPGKPGEIVDPNPSGAGAAAGGGAGAGAAGGSASAGYPEAVIAFRAEFYMPSAMAAPYLKPGGKFQLDGQKQKILPMFTRNMAVRR